MYLSFYILSIKNYLHTRSNLAKRHTNSYFADFSIYKFFLNSNNFFLMKEP